MSDDDTLLTPEQWADFEALLARRGVGDALGYLLVATAYAMQGRVALVDWASLGREDRAAEIVEGRISGLHRGGGHHRGGIGG